MTNSTSDIQPVSQAPTASPGPRNGRGRFTFQNAWFDIITSDWEELTSSLRGKKLRVLEIGSFEGASTTWILDNLMDHPESTMVAIDTFAGGMEHKERPDSYGLASLESRFWSNVSKCENAKKLRVMKLPSEVALITLRRERACFDFIYIDGSHVAMDVLQDAVLCWPMLEVQGTMVFDDFTWKGYNEHCYNPRIAIMSFLQCAALEVQTKETESQMWVTKVPNHTPATANEDPDLMYWDKSLRFTLNP